MGESECSHLELKWNKHLTSLTSKCHHLLQQEKFVDVILMPSNGQLVNAHRLILCASSQYFWDYFSQQADTPHIVTLKVDVKEEYLRSLIQYMYTGEVAVLQDQLSGFLQTASALKIHGLADHAEKPNEMVTPKETEMMGQFSSLHTDSTANFEPDVDEEETMMEEGYTERLDADEDEIKNDEGSQHSSLEDVSSNSNSSHASNSVTLFSNAESSNGIRITSVQSLARNKSVDGRPYKCDCGRSYKNKCGLNRHVINECGRTEKRFPCTQCDYRAGQLGSLRKHLINAHNINRSQLTAFGAGPIMKVRPIYPFKCTQCARTYKQKGSLNKHLKFECGLDPSFACSLCDYRAAQKGHLKAHMVNVHGVDSSLATAREALAPFKCKFCPFRSYREATLKKHLQTEHNGN